MKKTITVTTEDVLVMLCDSVTKVLCAATNKHIGYSGMVQKINKTCLRPDIGCFVLFDGGFSGLVVINFNADAAMEIYRDYLLSMGMSESDLATVHTSDEVSNVMGELMNQIVGEFTGKVRKTLQTSISQNQPKMLAINKQVLISVDTNLDRPQARRVTFNTESNNIFYLELAMDKTEFIQIQDIEQDEENPDSIFEQAVSNFESNQKVADEKQDDSADLLDSLGI